MIASEYYKKIVDLRIEKLGFDTHSRVLKVPKEEIKTLWNEATGNEFKRFPRTEYTMRFLPEYSTKLRPYWRLETPDDFLMFYLTPTSPIIIPNGFITDKGSIPLFFRNIISHDDREMILPFFVHDLECEMKRMTRFTVDGLLYEAGTELEANWFKKNFIYTAVRAAAWLPGKDRIRGGFNISKYNRELIDEAEKHFIEKYYPEHLITLEKLSV